VLCSNGLKPSVDCNDVQCDCCGCITPIPTPNPTTLIPTISVSISY